MKYNLKDMSHGLFAWCHAMPTSLPDDSVWSPEKHSFDKTVAPCYGRTFPTFKIGKCLLFALECWDFKPHRRTASLLEFLIANSSLSKPFPYRYLGKPNLLTVSAVLFSQHS